MTRTWIIKREEKPQYLAQFLACEVDEEGEWTDQRRAHRYTDLDEAERDASEYGGRVVRLRRRRSKRRRKLAERILVSMMRGLGTADLDALGVHAELIVTRANQLAEAFERRDPQQAQRVGVPR